MRSNSVDDNNAPLAQVAKERVRTMLLQGQKIQAIKYLCDEYQLSLKEAMHLVDVVARESRVASPFSFRSGRIVLFVFGGLGTFFLLIATYAWWLDYRITHDSIVVTGEVIDLDYSGGSGAAPVVAYTWKGKLKTCFGSTYSNPPAVEIGEQVEVLVNRNRPEEVVVNLITERFIFMGVFGFLGLVFGAIGFVGMFFMRPLRL